MTLGFCKSGGSHSYVSSPFMCNKCYTIGDEAKELFRKACRVPDATPSKARDREPPKGGEDPKTEEPPARAVTKETPEDSAKRRERMLLQIRIAEKEVKRLQLLKMVAMERQKLQEMMAAKAKSILADVMRLP